MHGFLKWDIQKSDPVLCVHIPYATPLLSSQSLDDLDVDLDNMELDDIDTTDVNLDDDFLDD